MRFVKQLIYCGCRNSFFTSPIQPACHKSYLVNGFGSVFQVVAYNDGTSGSNCRNMEAVDVKFQMNIGCIRVVFLNKFVMHLLVSILLCLVTV